MPGHHDLITLAVHDRRALLHRADMVRLVERGMAEPDADGSGGFAVPADISIQDLGQAMEALWEHHAQELGSDFRDRPDQWARACVELEDYWQGVFSSLGLQPRTPAEPEDAAWRVVIDDLRTNDPAVYDEIRRRTLEVRRLRSGRRSPAVSETDEPGLPAS